MLKNPDIQPNVTINQWIATILLFDFKLVHIPTAKHHGPDSLSQCEPVEGKEEEDDPEAWIDNALSLGLWVVSWTQAPHTDPCVAAWMLSIEVPVTPTSNHGTVGTASIPSDSKARRTDDKLELIHRYLITLKQPDHLQDAACMHLLKRVKYFFLAEGQLWHHQDQGHHQLCIPLPLCFPLIRDTHDNLGHKGFYSTCHTLLD